MVLSDDELRARVCGLAAERARLDGEFASAVAELDRRRLWAAEGCRSVGPVGAFAGFGRFVDGAVGSDELSGGGVECPGPAGRVVGVGVEATATARTPTRPRSKATANASPRGPSTSTSTHSPHHPTPSRTR